MRWKIEYSSGLIKKLKKLSSQDKHRILDFLDNRLAQSENPRGLGKALKGSRLDNLWRYRVGDYQIIAQIENEHSPF